MRSDELFIKSKKVVPGGVHSPVRSFKGLEISPRFIERANGAYIFDVDNKRYIDFCMSFGPLILGHKNEEVKEKLIQALDRGWSFGACEQYSLELAEFIVEKIPFIDQIRFVNSGTEAVMTAIRLARGVTGRSKIIKFNGCYHGHTDSMLIKAGSGLAGIGDASSRGVTKGVTADTLILELSDYDGIQRCFDEYTNDIAAIIIEPLPANNGLLIQDREFLSYLRTITRKYNSLLIFDEVISGFRIGFGGMAEAVDIVPDIVTYGKIIGGGLPVGAVAASKDIMGHLSPDGGVYQAGTLSANPLAMVGGLCTLRQLTDQFYKKLDQYSERIVDIFTKYINSNQKYDLKVTSTNSLVWISSKENVKRVCDIPNNIMNSFSPFFKDLLDKGIYLAPNPYEVGFVSIAHNEKIIEEIANVLGV